MPATSGNFSVRIDRLRIAITRSGVDKGALTHSDILVQEIEGPLLPGSSAEAGLHVRLYRDDPVFANDQHVAALSERVSQRLARLAPKGCHRAPGYLLAGHGLYAWGRSAAEAAWHLEALEVLFSQMLALRSYQP